MTGALGFKLLAWTVVIITYQLCQALQVLLVGQTIEEASAKMRVAITMVLALTILEVCFMLVIPFLVTDPERRNLVVSIDELVINGTLMVVFVLVTMKMIKMLSMFEESGSSFSRQKQSVIRQVLYFEISFSYIILT